MEENLDLSKKLKELLVSLRPDDEQFADCILVSLRTDEHKQKLIDLIEKQEIYSLSEENDITPSDMCIIASLQIRDGKI